MPISFEDKLTLITSSNDVTINIVTFDIDKGEDVVKRALLVFQQGGIPGHVNLSDSIPKVILDLGKPKNIESFIDILQDLLEQSKEIYKIPE